MSNPKVKLGQKVFVLSGRNVVRTMVGRIEIGGHYTLLNGDIGREPHWFSYEDAVDAARERLKAQRVRLQKALRQLTADDRHLQSENYRRSVEGMAYRMIDLGYEELRRFRPRMRKKVSVPETYLAPGQRVFAIITPATRPRYDGADVYRPFGHFILATNVKSVRLSPDGTALYTFTTPFRPEEFYLSRKQAEARLRSYSEPGTLEEVHFVSKAKEAEELKKLEDNSIPF